MRQRELARARLLSQGLVGGGWTSPKDAVAAFGLMQGQEHTVFSSVALRAAGGIDAVRAGLDAGDLVRAYPMRGTVFLGLARDMRWMTQLMAKPGRAQAAARAAQAGVSPQALDTIRERVLHDGPLTNAQLKTLIAEVAPDAPAAAVYRTRYALLVSGDFVYAGRDQRLAPAPPAPGLEEAFNGERQAAVDEVVRRYVDTHGPVSEADVRWWSKLPAREVRAALAALHSHGDFDVVDGTYMRAGLIDDLAATAPAAFRRPLLLPAFDEYILGYQDRLFAMTEDVHTHLAPSNMGVFRKAVVVDGLVRGTWKGAGGRLELEDVGGIPKYAHSGIRRAFGQFPFHTETL